MVIHLFYCYDGIFFLSVFIFNNCDWPERFLLANEITELNKIEQTK